MQGNATSGGCRELHGKIIIRQECDSHGRGVMNDELIGTSYAVTSPPLQPA